MPLGNREWCVDKGRCVLCLESDVFVFTFDDNKHWSKEAICRDCLWDALRRVNEAILKEEQKRNDN